MVQGPSSPAALPAPSARYQGSFGQSEVVNATRGFEVAGALDGPAVHLVKGVAAMVAYVGPTTYMGDPFLVASRPKGGVVKSVLCSSICSMDWKAVRCD